MHNKSNIETVLAFDFGLKQIGIAFGQTITNQSTGIKIIKAKNGVPNWGEIKIMFCVPRHSICIVTRKLTKLLIEILNF